MAEEAPADRSYVGLRHGGPGRTLWYAQVQRLGASYKSRLCSSRVEAARLYDDLVREHGLVGVKALNFPCEGEPQPAPRTAKRTVEYDDETTDDDYPEMTLVTPGKRARARRGEDDPSYAPGDEQSSARLVTLPKKRSRARKASKYAGVCFNAVNREEVAWKATVTDKRRKQHWTQSYPTEEEAARGHDELVRALQLVGSRPLNFPRPGECVPKPVAKRSPYIGVYCAVPECARIRGSGRMWYALLTQGGVVKRSASCFATPHEAAKAYDALVRRHGLEATRPLNFPDEGHPANPAQHLNQQAASAGPGPEAQVEQRRQRSDDDETTDNDDYT